jgi:hypothetical protein
VLHSFEIPLAAALGIALGLYLGIPVMRRIRTSKRFRIGAAITAGLFSFMTYQDPRGRRIVEESESETRRKKDKHAGDPPDPDDPDERYELLG